MKVVAMIYEGDEETPICTFGEAVANVEVTR